jgi:hypothetical protein
LRRLDAHLEPQPVVDPDTASVVLALNERSRPTAELYAALTNRRVRTRPADGAVGGQVEIVVALADSVTVELVDAIWDAREDLVSGLIYGHDEDELRLRALGSLSCPPRRDPHRIGPRSTLALFGDAFSWTVRRPMTYGCAPPPRPLQPDVSLLCIKTDSTAWRAACASRLCGLS